jgi:hypothetical protein
MDADRLANIRATLHMIQQDMLARDHVVRDLVHRFKVHDGAPFSQERSRGS